MFEEREREDREKEKETKGKMNKYKGWQKEVGK